MTEPHRQLKRQIGVGGATLLGLGSILGTGVFVSLGIAINIAGAAVLIAIVLAGFVALCNALSSAQLAAAYPVAGGTYEYGYRTLHPLAGFTAGWMFLVAKSASAATAALALTEYTLELAFRFSWLDWYGQNYWLVVGCSIGFVAMFVLLVFGGLRRASWVNAILVFVVVIVLGSFVYLGIAHVHSMFHPRKIDWFAEIGPAGEPLSWINGVLYASALIFVAYTGYGRIATLGEEVHRPQTTIPRAILAALVSTVVIYLAVAFAAILTASANQAGWRVILFGDGGPYLATLAPFAWANDSWMFGRVVITIAAVAAMGGVLLNLILGLSRVLLAMGRRGDMPSATAYVNKAGTTPTVAVLVVGLAIAALVLIGDVKATWSLSAFTVLIYYGITNAAALRLPPEHRRYPRAFAWIGLACCLLLAISVDTRTIAIGGSVLVVGWLWYAVARIRCRHATTRP